jgi:hypothetical protein
MVKHLKKFLTSGIMYSRTVGAETEPPAEPHVVSARSRSRLLSHILFLPGAEASC